MNSKTDDQGQYLKYLRRLSTKTTFRAEDVD
jgi:hypothetical protein